MPIQQVGFRTSALSYTAPKKGTGEALANLVVGSVKAVGIAEEAKYKKEKRDKLELEREELKNNREFQKQSNLVFLNARSDRQNKLNQFYAETPNYTSEQLAEFNSGVKQSQQSMYDSLTPEDQAKYNVYYSERDADVVKKQIKEEEQADKDIINEMVPQVTSMQELDDIIEFQNHGTVKKKDALIAKMDYTATQIELDFDSKKLDGMSVSDIKKKYFGTLYFETQDKSVTTKVDKVLDKINKKILKTQEENRVAAEILTGKHVDGISSSLEAGEVTKQKTKTLDKLIEIGELNKAIEIDNIHGGGNINLLNKIGDTFLAVRGEGSVSAFNMYKKTQNYMYSEKTKTLFNAVEAIARYNNLDLNDPAQMDSAINLYKEPTYKDEKLTINDVKDFGDSWLPFDAYTPEEEKFVMNYASKLAPFIGKEKAMEYAEKYRNENKVGLGWTGMSKTSEPIGLIGIKDEDGIKTFKRHLNAGNPENVDVVYDGKKNWVVDGILDPNGKETTRILTTEQMKQFNVQATITQDAIDTVDSAIQRQYGRQGYVQGKTTSDKINNLRNFFFSQIDNLATSKNIKLTDSQKIILKNEVLEQYKQLIVNRDSFTKEFKSTKDAEEDPYSVETTTIKSFAKELVRDSLDLIGISYGDKNNPVGATAKKFISYHGSNAVKEIEKREGLLSNKERRIAELEGFVNGWYKDHKGNLTFGAGQTEEYADMTFKDTVAAHEDTARRLFKNYDKYSERLQIELLQGVYRGDFKSTHTTTKLINKGKFTEASREFSQGRKDHSSARGELKKRLDAIKKALKEEGK